MENTKRNHKKQQTLAQSGKALSRKVSIHSKSINELGQTKPNTVKNDLKNNRLDDNKKNSFRVPTNDRKQSKSIIKQNIRQLQTKDIANKYKSNSRKSSLQKLSFLAPHMGKSLKLLLATLLDISTMQLHLKQIVSFSNSLSSISPSSIPYIYSLILEYEQQFQRAYTEEIRYYIIGALWDQGYVKIGKVDEWQHLIQQQYKGQKKQKLGIYERNKLNTEIVLLIECIEEQYHRQQITLQKLIECLSKQDKQELNDNNTYKRRMQNYSYRYKSIEQILYQLFDALDRNKMGSLALTDFIDEFYINQQTQPMKVYSNCIINKLCNNVHNFDKNTNLISNPFKHSSNKNGKQVKECRMHIENVRQLINRIYLHEPNASHHQVPMSEHVCCTYNSIAYILGKYQQMKGLVFQQLQSGEKQQVDTANDGIILRAEMDNIRRAATTIVKCRKAHLVNNLLTEPFQYEDYLVNELRAANSHQLYLNSKLESLYQTNKNQPHMIDDDQLTFRHKTQEMRIEQIEKEIPNITMSTGSESKIQKNTSKGRDTASTATAPVYRQTKDNSIFSIQNSVKTRERRREENNDKKLQIRIQDQRSTDLRFNQKIYTPQQARNNNNPQIRHFTTQKQPISTYSVFTSGEKTDPFNFHLKSNYDELLRSRIENELRTVELQKLKNRMKYYEIMYQ